MSGMALLTFLYLSFLKSWIEPLAIFILIGFVQSISDTVSLCELDITVYSSDCNTIDLDCSEASYCRHGYRIHDVMV
jgi:hypothetical protein